MKAARLHARHALCSIKCCKDCNKIFLDSHLAGSLPHAHSPLGRRNGIAMLIIGIRGAMPIFWNKEQEKQYHNRY